MYVQPEETVVAGMFVTAGKEPSLTKTRGTNHSSKLYLLALHFHQLAFSNDGDKGGVTLKKKAKTKTSTLNTPSNVTNLCYDSALNTPSNVTNLLLGQRTKYAFIRYKFAEPSRCTKDAFEHYKFAAVKKAR